MGPAEKVLQSAVRQPLSQMCGEDPQEKRFDALVKLWVDNEIPYSFLMRNFPDYESSVVSKLLRLLASRL